MGSEKDVGKPLASSKAMAKSPANFRNRAKAVGRIGEKEERRLKIGDASGPDFTLTESDRQTRDMNRFSSVVQGSRELELLRNEVADYSKWVREFKRALERGTSTLWLEAVERWVDRLQEARVYFRECRVLALWRCAIIRHEVNNNVGARRITDFYDCGLLTPGGGLSRAEVRDESERATRRVLGSHHRGAGGDGAAPAPVAGDHQVANDPGHGLPLCREVETWPTGEAIMGRSGGPWTWHT